MTDTEIADLWLKSKGPAKFVRAFCRAMGWRYTPQGAPEQWYAAWRAGVAEQLERAIGAKA